MHARGPGLDKTPQTFCVRSVRPWCSPHAPTLKHPSRGEWGVWVGGPTGSWAQRKGGVAQPGQPGSKGRLGVHVHVLLVVLQQLIEVVLLEAQPQGVRQGGAERGAPAQRVHRVWRRRDRCGGEPAAGAATQATGAGWAAAQHGAPHTLPHGGC
jgi:hypothetical protein